jgi:uncharacterized protein
MGTLLDRIRRPLVLVLATLVCWTAMWPARVAGASFPASQGYVSDFAGVLDAAGRTELEALLRHTEVQTTAEIAVVTVSSLDGMTVEEYASRLFAAWGIGKKGKDNGVLVLVAPTDRKIRIEVGYGLESVLPDGLAGEVIRTDFLPRFRDGDYRGGIQQGVNHVIGIVQRHEPLSAEERRRLGESSAADRPPTLIITPFLGLFIALGAVAVGAGLRTKTLFALIWGGTFGGIPLVMALIPFFNASRVVLLPIGVAMLALGYTKAGHPKWRATLRGKTRVKSSGWTMGTRSASSGESGSSRSSGGGDFGGGSSGGGGASGSW